MKTILSLGVVFLALVSSASAQIFGPRAANGAILGGLAGAVIGNNSGSLNHNAWRGAAVGAAAGLLIGSAMDDVREPRAWRRTQVARPEIYIYRHGHGRHGGYSHHRSIVHRPGYYRTWPDYRASGVFFGGLSGAVIGHNSRGLHHNAWRGAAWGAGLGYVFGSIAEQNHRARTVIERSPALVLPPPAPAVQPQQITIINNYYGGAAPMSSANGLFGR